MLINENNPGSENPKDKKLCPECNGKGIKNISELTSEQSETCKFCKGSGYVSHSFSQKFKQIDIDEDVSNKANEFKEIRIQAHTTSDAAMLTSASDPIKLTPNLQDFYTPHFNNSDNYNSTNPVENVSNDELKELAEQSYNKKQWEVAETLFRKLLEGGEPIYIIGPKIFNCIINAHPKLSDNNKKKLTDILDQLKANGNTEILSELKKQLEERTAPDKKDKKGWNFWKK